MSANVMNADVRVHSGVGDTGNSMDTMYVLY